MPDLIYKASLTVLPLLYVVLTRVWFSTCRVEIEGQDHLQRAVKEGGCIGVFWHYSFAYIFYQLRKYPVVAMVSASRDGEYIARVVRLFGHAVVRGSSHRGGVRALKGIIDQMRSGLNAGIVGDGSQGPARKMQGGAILLAAKSGKPIVPMVCSAQKYITFHSWDRTILPLPFTKVYVKYGEPMAVEQDIRSEELEAYRLTMESRLNTLYRQVWQKTGRLNHDGIEGEEQE